jgi:hypothetical protein
VSRETRAAATRRFVALVGGSADFPLDEAAALVAAHHRPGLDVGAVLGRLDSVAAGARDAGVRSFDGLRSHLFAHLGFRGDMGRYHDPRNSMIDLVLDRRLGIPITLAVVMIEVGRRLGVGVVPVGMPGHFLVGDPARPGVWCDPFGGGALLDEDGCRARFESVHGEARGFSPSFLAATAPRAVVARVLVNLEQGPLGRDLVHLAWIVRLQAAIPGLAPATSARLAPLLEAAGLHQEAARLYAGLAALTGGDAERILRRRAGAAVARLN